MKNIEVALINFFHKLPLFFRAAHNRRQLLAENISLLLAVPQPGHSHGIAVTQQKRHGNIAVSIAVHIGKIGAFVSLPRVYPRRTRKTKGTVLPKVKQ